MSAQSLRVCGKKVTVERRPSIVIVAVTAPEGDQATYRGDDGRMYIELALILTADELVALVGLLEGRQIAIAKDIDADEGGRFT